MHAPNSSLPDGLRLSNDRETGYVFVDEEVGVEPGPWVYSGVVQPGGYVEVSPTPLELPAIGAAWFVSVATEEDGSARSTWVNALEVVAAGDAVTPNVVTNEEDASEWYQVYTFIHSR